MKIILFFALIAVAFAGPQGTRSDEAASETLKQEYDLQPDGSYKWSYETSNNIAAEEQGTLKNVGSEEPILDVQGQFKYNSDDGNTYQVSYIANENGFQPQGAHLPTPHPIPEAIQRALAYIATAPPPKPEKP